MHPTISKLLAIAVAWFAFKLLRMGRRDKRLPPGPPTVPILGNILQLPRTFLFLKFSEFAKEYGGIFSLKVANETIIVLSDANIVKEILDDRPNETSNRPFFHSLDAVTGGNYLPLAPSGSQIWKVGRRALHHIVSPQAVQAHVPIIDAETTQLLHDVLHEPNHEIQSHIVRFALSFVSSVAYGKRVPTYDSSDLTMFTEYFRHFSQTISPGAAPVDLVPILACIPEVWAPWRRLWRKTRSLQRALYFSMLDHAEQKFHQGQRDGSIIGDILESQSDLKISREMIGYVGGMMLDGGTDTTSSVIQSFILCLIQYPATLKKAQDEIDSVVGKQRLPNTRDINDLPYVQAIIRELHRLRPAAPTAAPHTAVQDIQYQGYTIPKGAPIFINTWGIMHDPELFERPEEFWPERFLLTPDGTKPGLDKGYTIRSSFLFGSGKRLCPGMHLANHNINLVIMRLIWAFDFAPMHDAALPDSRKWEISEEYNDGITLSPKSFKCKITPRDRERVEVIEESFSRMVSHAT